MTYYLIQGVEKTDIDPMYFAPKDDFYILVFGFQDAMKCTDEKIAHHYMEKAKAMYPNKTFGIIPFDSRIFAGKQLTHIVDKIPVVKTPDEKHEKVEILVTLYKGKVEQVHASQDIADLGVNVTIVERSHFTSFVPSDAEDRYYDKKSKLTEVYHRPY